MTTSPVTLLVGGEEATSDEHGQFSHTVPLRVGENYITVTATRQYVYQKDFNIGDIVQVANEFDITGTVYISEVVMSQDANEISITPTFTSTEDETIE